jgi:rod shape determining protein RodA
VGSNDPFFRRAREGYGRLGAGMSVRALLRDFDWVMFSAVAAVLLLGLITLYSASRQSGSDVVASHHSRQAIWTAVGFCAMLAVIKIDYHRFLAFAPLIYGVVLVGLMYLAVVALISALQSRGTGAHRWIDLGPFQVQPSEFCKVGVVLLLARYFDAVKAKIRRPRFFIGAIAIVAVPVMLIAVEPDLGTAAVFVPVVLVMLYLAGSKTKHRSAGVGLSDHSVQDSRRERQLSRKGMAARNAVTAQLPARSTYGFRLLGVY